MGTVSLGRLGRLGLLGFGRGRGSLSGSVGIGRGKLLKEVGDRLLLQLALIHLGLFIAGDDNQRGELGDAKFLH